MATAKSPKGFILYEGPSVLDGKPIVVIATMKTKNRKTGDVVQTWILRSDLNPIAALEARADESICGGCPHRRSIGGACYVNVGQAPLAIWKAYKAGSYGLCLWPELSDAFKGKTIRLGAYGDPAAVPAHIWDGLLSQSKAHMGYTHQLAHKNFDPAILEFCMVSADTPKVAAKAQAQGLRTFRVKSPEAPLLAGEVICLADSKGMSCAECKACDGAKADGPSIVIDVHGSLATRYESKYRTINLRVA